MASEDTVQPQWYAPWPSFGKALSQQWGAIRHDTSYMAPIVRGAGLDASGDFTTLDGVEKTAVQAWKLGEDGFHNRFRMHYNKDDDLFEIQANVLPGTTQIPNWYTAWAVGSDGQVTQQTSATTASNVGTGADVFKQKSGVDLQFRSIKATGVLSVAENALDLTLTSSAEANTTRSDGGVSLVKAKSGSVLPFKGLTAGNNMEFSNGTNSITLHSTVPVFYALRVMYDDLSKVYPSVHNFKVNVNHFYLTQKKSNPSAKEVNLNLRGSVFNPREYVAVAGDAMTGALLHPDGTAGAPAVSFSEDTDTGLTRLASDDLALVSGGTSVLRALTDRVYLPKNLQVLADGNAGAPDIFWFSNSTTGLFQNTPGDDSIAFTTGGVRAGYFDASQNLHVQNDLKSSRVEAGIGNFYTSLIVGSTATLKYDGNLLIDPQGLGGSGYTDFMGAIFVAEDENTAFSRFGGDPTALNPNDNQDMLVTRKARTGTGGNRRALLAVLDINFDSGNYNNASQGLNGFVYTGETQNVSNNSTSLGGGATGGRYAFRHEAEGTFSMGGGLSAWTGIEGDHKDGVILDAFSFLDEGGDGGTGGSPGGGSITRYKSFWIRDSAGDVGTKYGLYIDDLMNATNNIGIRIDSVAGVAGDYAIWIGASGAWTDAANGITFGSGADVNLYRSADATLKTDGSFVVPEDAYGDSWDSNSSVPTKNAIYDHLETLDSGFYALTVRESGPGRVLQSDTITFDTAGFYVSVGGDGKPLISPQGTIIRTDTHEGIYNLLHLNDGGLGDDEALGMAVSSDGATITLTITNAASGKAATDPLELQFEGQNYTYTPSGGAETLTLTAGTATVPVENFVVFELSGGVPFLATSITDWPSDTLGEHHGRVCTIVVQDAGSVQTHGVLKIHAWTDHIEEVHGAGSGERGERGHLHSLAERLRNEPAVWRSGSALTVDNSGTTDPLYVHIASGTGYQLHRHSSPALDTDASDSIWVVNDDTTPYTKIDSLDDITRYATGGDGAIGVTAKFTVVLWMVVNENPSDTKLFLNVPTGGYNTVSAAKTDSSNKRVHGIPQAYVGTAILLYELVLSRSGGGSTWTVEDTVDLRGVPGVAVGGGGAATTGEVNTASNVGAGAGVFAQKTSIDLEFKSIRGWDGAISVTSDADEIFIGATGSFYTPVTIDDDLTVTGEVLVADDVYAAGWDTDLSVPTKNALYDKLEAMVGDISNNTTHASSDGSDHSFIDQSVVNGSSPVFTGTNITGVPAANILAGTFGTGAYAFDDDLEVLNDLKAGRVEAGIGKFYAVVLAGSRIATPWSNISVGPSDESGMGLSWGIDQLYFRVPVNKSFRFRVGNVDTLGVDGSTVTAEGTARFATQTLGSVGAPVYSQVSDANTGMYFPAANNLGFTTGGVQAGYFDSDQNLHVTDNVFADSFYMSIREQYTETNVSEDRAFDADTVAIAELADVVGTLIKDLKQVGIIK